jgi:uncharacterized membrane protein YhaH (DUF805 family)
MQGRLEAVLKTLQRPFNPLLELIPNRLRPFLDFRGRSQRSDFITLFFASLSLSAAAYFILPVMEHRIITPGGIIVLPTPKTPAQWLLETGNWFLSIWYVVFLCRRLHDQNLSAILLVAHFVFFWLLGSFIFAASPTIIFAVSFWTVILIAILRRGTVGPNRFGADPRGWESPQHYEREQVRLKSGNI